MSVKISRILHAGYLFESNNSRIAFDPVFENPFSSNCYAYPNVEFNLSAISDLRLDAVFISHYHEDHFSVKSLDLLNRNIPIYLFSLHEEHFAILKELGFKKIHSLKPLTFIEVGKFKITVHPAVDEAVDSIFEITVDGLNILNVVDAWIPDFVLHDLAKKSWNLILWPFQTMREVEVLAPLWFAESDRKLPSEWIEQINFLAPKFIVPSSCQFIQESWSWIRNAYFPISYENFAKSVVAASQGIKVQRMNPGESFELTDLTLISNGRLPWIQPVGDQNIDYIYEPKYESVKMISKNFPALSELQKEEVVDFCQHQINPLFEQIGPSADAYFNKVRIWKLNLFFRDESSLAFYYRLNDSELSLTSSIPEATEEWLSEIPAYKLYMAIAEGEPLTSLYLQVNSRSYSEKLTTQLSAADPLQDPLIRILSARRVDAYHRAQLKKI